MPATKRILVPIDGSECSLHALRYAGERQRSSSDLELIVLHVQSLMRPSRVVTRSMVVEHQSRNSEAAMKRARALIKRMKIDASCHVRTGEPAPIIVALARKKKCGEIVLGNSGLGQIAGMVLGSVARKVVFLAQCPVTLVK